MSAYIYLKSDKADMYISEMYLSYRLNICDIYYSRYIQCMEIKENIHWYHLLIVH